MVRYSLPLALLVLACSALPARAQQQASPAPQTKRWTNADMAELRERGLISIVGQETQPTPAAAPEAAPPAASAPSPGQVDASYLEDPAWYAEQAAALQAELAARAVALAQAQMNLAEARNLRGATGSVNILAAPAWGVTPEEVIADLQAQVSATQSRLDELADLARRNYVAPGVLRAAAA